MASIRKTLDTAVAHHQAGRLEEAVRSYRRAIKIKPDLTQAHNNLGVALKQQGRLDEAVSAYRRALRFQPDYAEAHNNLGNALKAQGKLDEALMAFRKALRCKPNYIQAHSNLGNALKEQGKLDEAVSAYRRALEIHPDYAEAHYNLGNALSELEQWDQAADSYRQALRIRPDHADALCNLGNALKGQGKLDAAAEAYQTALRIRPDYAEAYSNLGVTLWKQGQPEEAVQQYRRALQIRPDYALVHHSLGVALLELGKTDEAVQACQQALRIDPHHAQAHYNLGVALCGQEKFDQAVQSFRQALQLQQDYAEAHNNLGVALKEQGNLDEALQSYRRALEIKPQYPEALTNLGNALKELGDLAAAGDAYRQALELDPLSAAVHSNLGVVLREQGRLAEAVDAYRRALELKPDYAEAWADLTQARKYSPQDKDEIEKIEKLLDNGQLGDLQRSKLHFALGKIYDDCRDCDRAFANYRQGNDLVDVDYDDERAGAEVDAVITHCTRAFLEKGRQLGDPSELPVLIVGMPRSGTTLVEQILASHPAVHGSGELPHLADIARELSRQANSNIGYAACLPKLTAELARSAAQRYLQQLRYPEHTGRVTDKMPSNFLRLGLVAMLLPNARIIHCRRHPLDVCLSNYFSNFKNQSGLRYTFDLHSLGLYYRQYARLMDHWRHVLPLRMLEVDYEQLVQNQERISRELVEFCGLDWDPACLDFHKTEREVRTASNWQVRQPIYATSVARWTRYERHLDPLKEALGWDEVES